MKRSALLWLLVSLCCLNVAALKASVLVGVKAPLFERTDVEGVRHSLAEQKGKLVILEWVNPDCPYDRDFYTRGAIPKLQSFAKEHGMEWWLIDSTKPDSPSHLLDDKLKAWVAAHHGCPSAIVRDADGSLLKLFGTPRTPGFVMVEKSGYVAYFGGMDNRFGRKDIPDEKLTHYVEEALECLLHNRAIPNDTTSCDGTVIAR